MAISVVMEPPGLDQHRASAAAVFVRDGFSWPAFLIPPVWLLWNQLWIEAALVLAIGTAVTALAELAGLGPAGGALSLLVSVFVGLEGTVLRVNALRRRGWHEWGVVEAHDAAEAEIRFAAEAGQELGTVGAVRAALPAAPAARPVHAGAALGLLGYSSRL